MANDLACASADRLLLFLSIPTIRISVFDLTEIVADNFFKIDVERIGNSGYCEEDVAKLFSHRTLELLFLFRLGPVSMVELS